MALKLVKPAKPAKRDRAAEKAVAAEKAKAWKARVDAAFDCYFARLAA